MKKTALLLLLPLFSFLFQPLMGKEESKYKLISYNIRMSAANDGANSWKYRECATKQMFNQEKPDVIGVQEALLDQLNYIKKEVPQYGYVGVSRDSGKQDNGETMAIFYLRDRFDCSTAAHSGSVKHQRRYPKDGMEPAVARSPGSNFATKHQVNHSIISIRI